MMKAALATGFARASSSSGKGDLRRMRSVRSSTASKASTTAPSDWPKVSRRAQRARLAAQSRASTGSPSWKRSPSRSRIVQVRLSSETWCPSAICGRTCRSSVSPYSVSKMVQPWFSVTPAVVQIGSSEVRFACGTIRRVRARMSCPMAGPEGNTDSDAAGAAAAALSRLRLCMAGLPGQLRGPCWHSSGG